MCDIEKEAKTTRYDEFVSGSGALFFELRTHEGASVQRARTAKAACDTFTRCDLDFLDARGTFVCPSASGSIKPSCFRFRSIGVADELPDSKKLLKYRLENSSPFFLLFRTIYNMTACFR